MNESAAVSRPSRSVRACAVHALASVFRRDRFVDAALEEQFAKSDLAAADRRLLTELVYGTLRQLATLDRAIDRLAKKGKDSLPPAVLHVLRVSLYQLLFLERVPDYAAVSQAVDLVKETAPGMAGMVNAILRRVAGEPDAWRTPEPTGDDVTDLALAGNHPRWLVEMWLPQFGPEGTAALCAANNRQAPLFGRVNTLRMNRDELLKKLQDEGVSATPHPWFDDALALPPHVVVGELESFRAGLFVVQDPSQMLPARLVAPQPGEQVYDACAAPGGKTAHLAALADNQARIYAVDRDKARLKSVKEAVKRLGLEQVKLKDGDATRGVAGMPQTFDAVLIDAPCSGLGTLRRRVDLRWRLQPRDLDDLVKIQRNLLKQAARKLGPGGRLVYSTCTINPRENHELIDGFLRRFPEFTLDDPRPLLPAACHRFVSDEGYVRMFQHVDDVDGSFCARLVKQ